MDKTIYGVPLDEIGLRDLEIVDRDGNVLGSLSGFAVLPGETIIESIQRSLKSGEYIRVRYAAA
jgi:hypothetical protein